jgi:hypothetical protein
MHSKVIVYFCPSDAMLLDFFLKKIFLMKYVLNHAFFKENITFNIQLLDS